MPTRSGLKKVRAIRNTDYVFCRWDAFDYTILQNIECRRKQGHSDKTYNDIIMMADTETSKKEKGKIWHNHICAWSLSMRAYNHNIATLWGQDPRDFPHMIDKILAEMDGEETYLYFHNLAYDHCFLRRFMYEYFGEPESQLNIRPLYPLIIRYANGLIVKDSLMLAQRRLERWAADMNVTHKKAVGFWDYDKIRNQSDELTEEELRYIECDVLAGVECIDATLDALHKNIATIPFTATGIPRGEARAIGKKYHAYDQYVKQTPEEYELQARNERLFHGGYTHNNRYSAGKIYPAKCKDFSSSYPYHAIVTKMPSERFWRLDGEISPAYIIKNSETWAFTFRVQCIGLDLQDLRFPMPSLASSKCSGVVGAIVDNGRILRANYIDTYMNEIDFKLFVMIYKWENIVISDVYTASKDYLPKWYTDYIFKCFENKTMLKGIDPVLYSIEKSKLNAIAFGVIAQHPIRATIEENYETGEYYVPVDFDFAEEYLKKINNRNNFLPYHWAMYITSAAQYSLFRFAMNCIDFENGGIWLYSDTDSVYGTEFNEKMVAAYNEECKKKLQARGYGCVEHKGREYWLGIAEDDGDYSEFKGLHAKCYACRDRETGKLKITVAGVPKKGVECLENNLDNFHAFTVFPGEKTGKLQHKYFYVDKIYTDENGNVTGDSIDLSPCDYIIGDEQIPTVDMFESEEVFIQVYE